jgi:hypothetical protein|tara:strand:- start:3893 stop:4096 length:204 start_codon:yes stop_codon:yes gene_type:complete
MNNMNKYKISVMERGYIIKENYIMAEDEDDAQERFDNEEDLENLEWITTQEEMSEDNVEITKVKESV